MALQFDISISTEDSEIQRFLLDTSKSQKTVEPILDTGFYYPAKYTKELSGWEQPLELEFAASESWYIYKRTAPWPKEKIEPDFSDKLLGSHKINLILGVSVMLKSSFYLSLRKGIDEEKCKADMQALLDYTPKTEDQKEFETYIKDNVKTLQDGDYIIRAVITIIKTSEIKEIDVRERELLNKLFNTYELDGSIFLLGGNDYKYSTYIKDNDIFAWKGKYEELDKTPIITTPSVEISENDYKSDPGLKAKALTDLLDPFLDKLFPIPCGELKRKEYQFMTFPTWPEVKVEFKAIILEINCVRVTLYVPIIRIRTSELEFYVYFSIFKDAKKSVLMIAENCAKKAAIEAAVVGLILLNPGVALAQFESSFKSCVINDIMSCIDAGIYTIKIVGEWS